MSRLGEVAIENARIIFKNFSGRADDFNNAGDRNFGVIIDHDTAERLVSEGWNVKYLRPREEGDDPTPYIKVKFKYTERSNPNIYKIEGNTGVKTRLDETTVGGLDYDEFDNVDIVIRPYEWERTVKGQTTSGVTAYVKAMYVTVVSDYFGGKYN